MFAYVRVIWLELVGGSWRFCSCAIRFAQSRLGRFFCWSPYGFLGYCRKGFFSGPGRPGAQQLLKHACTRLRSKPTSRVLLVSLPTRTRSNRKPSLHTGFSTSPRIHSVDRGFSGPSAARIEIPRARDVEIKALPTQRRVLKIASCTPCHLEV